MFIIMYFLLATRGCFFDLSSVIGLCFIGVATGADSVAQLLESAGTCWCDGLVVKSPLQDKWEGFMLLLSMNHIELCAFDSQRALFTE